MGKPDWKWKVRKFTDSNDNLNRQVLQIRRSWTEIESLLKSKKSGKK